MQEFLGKAWKPLGNLDWLPASMLATSLVVLGWGYTRSGRVWHKL